MQLDRNPLTGEAYANPLLMRTGKLHALLGLRNRGVNVLSINFNQLVQSVEQVLTELSGELFLECRYSFDFMKRRYARKWQNKISRECPADIDGEYDYIVSQLDLEIEDFFEFKY